VSSLGLMPFFIEFLKTSGLFDKWVEECPLHYSSGNAPQVRDVLGTLVLSVLAGHWRYAHISAIRGDGINPGLLGMTGVASEDSVRRGMKAMDEAASGEWMKKHLKASYAPLLQEPWILDVDATVKPCQHWRDGRLIGHMIILSVGRLYLAWQSCKNVRNDSRRQRQRSACLHDGGRIRLAGVPKPNGVFIERSRLPCERGQSALHGGTQ
jgi:hypothetical protein